MTKLKALNHVLVTWQTGGQAIDVPNIDLLHVTLYHRIAVCVIQRVLSYRRYSILAGRKFRQVC